MLPCGCSWRSVVVVCMLAVPLVGGSLKPYKKQRRD
jgi:hypothetical protein